MSTVITTAGEQLIAQKIGAAAVLSIDTIILANIPDLDVSLPVDRSEEKPEQAHVVHEYVIPEDFKGYVNPNQVVYSMLLGSEIGNFQFNWLGLYSSVDDVLVAVTHLPVTEKWQTDKASNTLGNNLTRNFLLEFSGAKAVTNVTVEAKTWQVDFTARLRSIDERERLSNRDIYGRSCFFNDGFSVGKEGSNYVLKAGAGYVEGIRCVLKNDTQITVSALPKNVFLDVSLQQQGSDVVPVIEPFLVQEKVDFEDANLAKHYLVKVAEISAVGVVTDTRRTETVVSDLVEYLKGKADSHAQDKEDPHETMKKVATEIEKHASRTDDPHEILPLNGEVGNSLLKGEDGLYWGTVSTGINGGCIWFDGAVNADGRPIDAKTGQPDLRYGVCDGRTYTAPDGRQVSTINARDRFIIAAGGTYSVGNTGGAEQVSLSSHQNAKHYHLSPYTNDTHSFSSVLKMGTIGSNGGVDAGFRDLTTDGKQGQATDEEYVYRTLYSGGSQSHENRPPYLGLFLIKRL